MRFTTHSVSDDAFSQWVNKVKQSPEVMDFAAFKQVGEPGEMVHHRYPIYPIRYFGQVEANLFNKVIGQYVTLKDSHSTAMREAAEVQE